MKSISFMKQRLFCALCGLALFSVGATAQTVKTLNPLTTFGPSLNGRIEPPVTDTNYPPMDTGSNQRGMAIDPVTGNMVLVDTHTGGGGGAGVQGNIFIVDGTYGTNLAKLNINGIAGGNYADASVVVADDGAIYVCNQVSASASTPFMIYRWPSVTSVDPPTIVFSNTISPGQRYGLSIDARGSGTNTQIIMGSLNQSGSSGTNVVVFTTDDGTNLTAKVLGTDTSLPSVAQGIAFGSGNTFWCKNTNSAPLRLMSFSLSNSNATTIASFDTNALPISGTLGPIAVDNVNHLLAAIDVASSGSERVFLYDISDSNHPSLLDIKNFNPNNANAFAPFGYLDFNNGRLYAHVVNNGLAAFSVDDISTPAPTFVLQPPASKRLVSGQALTLAAVAVPGVTYQWQKDGSNIANSTNASLIINSVVSTNSGTYRVMAHNAGGDVPSSETVVQVVNLGDLFHLSPLWGVGQSSSVPWFN
jgi:hypothetical protein